MLQNIVYSRSLDPDFLTSHAHLFATKSFSTDIQSFNSSPSRWRNLLEFSAT